MRTLQAMALCAKLLVYAAVAGAAEEGVCDATKPESCGPTAGGRQCGSHPGLFLALAKQPDLGLRYLIASTEAQAIAVWSNGRCQVEYFLECSADGEPHVKPSRRSCDDSFASYERHAERSAEKFWEVCASSGGELRLRQPVIDLTFDAVIPANDTAVVGCIQLFAADAWPELMAVRGPLEAQRAALVERKQQVGGCPTWRSPEDYVARGDDFSAGGYTALGLVVKQYQKYLVQQASELKKNGPPEEESMMSFGLIGTIIALNDFKNTEAYLAFTKANCGITLPLGIGVMAQAKYFNVAAAAEDPNQKRKYFCPWASGCSDICFHPTLPLFLSSGSAEHTQTRKLWDEATMRNMAKDDFSDISKSKTWMRLFRDTVGLKEPTEEEVASLVAPLLIERVFQKRPTEREAELFAQYAIYGKLCIKSAMISKSPWVPGKIVEIRTVLMKFALDSPTAMSIGKMLATPEYSAVRKLYESSGKPLLEVAVQNLGDATLFAGLVGTTDMTWKCVKYLFRNQAHVRMFRRNPTDYLWELMRVQPSVQGFTTALKQPETFRMYGEDVRLPVDTPYKFSSSMANRDPNVFTDPSKFLFGRPWEEMGEMLTWNGKLKHVVSRNYTGAPRHCPGHDLSVKIGSHVCEHLTRHLAEWGQKAQDSGVQGIVKIRAPGPLQGREGVVTHFDFHSGTHCVIDRYTRGAHLGCYQESDLQVIKATGGIAHTLEDELGQCPSVTPSVVRMVARFGVDSYQLGGLIPNFFKSENTEVMTPDWADDYIVSLYGVITHIALRMYASRHSDSVMMPTSTGLVLNFKVGHISAPNVDIDHPHFLPIEWFVPQSIFDMAFLPSFNCFHGALRQMPWDDAMDDEERNQWTTVFNNARKHYKRKRDYVISFYEPYETQDGVPLWPGQENDLAALYLKSDVWDDNLEKAIAFGLIGSHRVEQVATPFTFAGDQMQFVVRLNQYSSLEVRPHFGQFGRDLYFNRDGLPIMIETTEGRKVKNGDKDWQYHKFAWRSSLVTLITLVDHLHLAHFRVGNVLAGAVRKTLSPKHPMRRLFSIFTFGTIFVNMNAMHTLIGPRHVLHRSTPFRDFESLSNLVPETLMMPTEQHKPLINETEFSKMHPLLQETPYFADGRLLVGAIQRFVDDYLNIYYKDVCDASDSVADPDVRKFISEIVQGNTESHYATPFTTKATCRDVFSWMVAYIWTVTGWHRHVGTVGDYLVDPDLASFSWKEGEAHSRPLQHMIMSTVAAFTSTAQPKLSEDYSHVFKGIDKEAQALVSLKKFQEELRAIHDEIAKRNEKRLATVGYKNVHADPDIVECSVAV